MSLASDSSEPRLINISHSWPLDFNQEDIYIKAGMMREKSIYFNISAGRGLRIPWVILLAYSVEIGLSRQHPKASRTKRIIYLLFVLSSFRLKRARPYQR